MDRMLMIIMEEVMMLIIMSVVVISSSDQTAGVEREYCIRETFNVTCPGENDVIVMTSGMYGRMRASRCINENHGQVGCMTSVTSQLDSRCSGRRRCQYPVKDLMDLKPCQQDDLHSFLIAAYQCVQVSHVVCVQTGGQGGTIRGRVPSFPSISLTDQDGYIMPSHFSSRCPWNITVDPRQTLKFSLFDFRSESPHPDALAHPSGMGRACPWSLVFEEKVEGRGKEEPLCQMRTREAVFYRSRSHSVLVSVLHTQSSPIPTTYLLKYEAQGCPSIRPADNSYVTYAGNTASIRCNYSGEVWYLACQNRAWTGVTGNCTLPPGDISGRTSGDATGRQGKTAALPLGFVMAVVVGVLLGVFIGAVPLALVYGCLRRKWSQQQLRAGGPLHITSVDGGGLYERGTGYDEAARSMYPALLDKHPNIGGDCCHSPHDPYSVNTCMAYHHTQAPHDSGVCDSSTGVGHWTREGQTCCPDITRPSHHVYESAQHGTHQPLVYYDVDATAMTATINRSHHHSPPHHTHNSSHVTC